MITMTPEDFRKAKEKAEHALQDIQRGRDEAQAFNEAYPDAPPLPVENDYMDPVIKFWQDQIDWCNQNLVVKTQTNNTNTRNSKQDFIARLEELHLPGDVTVCPLSRQQYEQLDDVTRAKFEQICVDMRKLIYAAYTNALTKNGSFDPENRLVIEINEGWSFNKDIAIDRLPYDKYDWVLPVDGYLKLISIIDKIDI